MIKVERDALKDALATVAPAVAKVTHLPILQGIHLHADGDRLHMRAMNLSVPGGMTITASCPAAGELPPTVVHAEPVKAFIGKAGDVLELQHVTETGGFAIAGARSRLELRTMDAGQFPESTVAEGDPHVLSGEVLERIGRIVFAAHRGGKTSRSALEVVHFGDGEAATTDSYRLAITELPAGMPEVSIPYGTIAAVVAAVGPDGCTFTADELSATFATERASWTTRLVTEAFPNYRNLIPKDATHEIVIERAALRGALALASQFGEQVRLAPEDGELVVTLRENEQDLETRIEAGAVVDFPVTFTARFLRELLEAGTGDDVTLRLVDPLKPVLVEEPGFTFLQMPVWPRGDVG